MTISFTFILGIVCILLVIFLCFSVYLNIKLGLTILGMEDGVTDCLDILDERYESMSKILEIPVFFDSLEIRQVIDDIRVSRNALLVVANILSESSEEKNIKELPSK